MNRKKAIAWVVNVCSPYLLLSQAKPLGALVSSAMRCNRISLANTARQMEGTVKHQIKRCWRFCANDRIETADAMRGIVAKKLKRRKKKLHIAIDREDIIAYLLLCRIGIVAKQTCVHQDGVRPTRPGECSIFTIGIVIAAAD